MSGGLAFTTLTAVELIDARAEVFDFAEELQQQDLKAYDKACKTADRAGKPRPQRPRLAFDLDFAKAESRRIRLKRERDATHFNQLTNPVPTR